MKNRHLVRFRLLAIILLACWIQPAVALASPVERTLSSGHFFSEAGGSPGRGYVIADSAAGNFWTSFQALGGVAALGYPASFPYQRNGFSYQATQGAVLQWRPDVGRAVLANTFEQLSAAGVDQQLFQERQIPYPITDDGSQGNYARAVQTRMQWMTDAGIAAHYLANPNPVLFPNWNRASAIQLYGLPMSRPVSFGPFVSQRFQRIVFQRWVQPVPGMPAPGTVVRVLGGDIAKAFGIVPDVAQRAAPSPTSPLAQTEFDQAATAGFVPSTTIPPPATARVIEPVAPIDLFPLYPCRASVLDPNADQNVRAHAAPEAGAYQVYGSTAVKIEHNNNCWSPSQIIRMHNHRRIQDITEVVIHWSGLDYQRSAYVLRRGVSANWLVPRAPNPHEPPLELIDPRNAAWHAGPLNRGLWEDAAHRLCIPGDACAPNGNVHSLGFENVGDTVPNRYQIGVMTDILAGLIREGYPIQLDRQHIVGHRELNRHKADPGRLNIDDIIAIVKQKLAPPPVAPTPAPPITPIADGSSAHPYPLTAPATGHITGSSGGGFTFYTLPPQQGTFRLHFAYQGMAAPAGAVGITVYQGTLPLGTLSPPGSAPDGQQMSFTPTTNTPLVVQVFSYIPQPVSYRLAFWP